MGDDLLLTAIRSRVRHAALLAACSAAACLAGCAEPQRIFGLTTPPVDANSPIAKDVIYASEHPGPFPRFSDIPKTPTDVRPVGAWRAAVTELQQRRTALESDIAAFPPPPTDTEAFAEAQRRKAVAPAPVAPPANAEQQTEAYARALRERAKPPPSSR